MRNLLAGIAAWLGSFNFTRDITVAYIGVPLNVLVACAIGTFCSFAWTERVTPRSKMWKLAAACIFMGAALTGVTNFAIGHYLDMKMTDPLQAGMGAIISCLTRVFMPWLMELVRTGGWIHWLPWLRKKNGE